MAADGPSNPYDLLKGLEVLRSAFATSGTVSDSLPAALERAAEVRESIDRLTAEVATLNRHVERALPVVESFENQFGRVLPLLESIMRAERGIQRVIKRGIKGVQDSGKQDPPGGEA